MIYEEMPDKLELDLSESQGPVILKVTCFNQTVTIVRYHYLGLHKLLCGEEGQVGNSQGLKGKTRLYTGSANNPAQGAIKVQHEFTAPNGKKLIYTFPDDYTGAPPFPTSDKNPTWQFLVKYT